jgi:hypothetical protein
MHECDGAQCGLARVGAVAAPRRLERRFGAASMSASASFKMSSSRAVAEKTGVAAIEERRRAAS